MIGIITIAGGVAIAAWLIRSIFFKATSAPRALKWVGKLFLILAGVGVAAYIGFNLIF